MSEYASCCVLSYERPRFLRDCLDTLVRNAGAPLELIVHDDGSRDPAVRRVIDEFLDAGLLSTVVVNAAGHNQGQGVALNRMFRMATGDPIVKLDQDLLFGPDWLHRVQQLLHDNALGKEAVENDDPLIGLLGLFHYHHEPCDSAKTKIEQFSGWSSRTHILGSAFAVRRRCWEELGPYEEHSAAFAEDWVLQRAVTDSPHWVCALPDEDLVQNRGFGIGPSTVVIAEGQVCPIHEGPWVVGRR